MHSPYASKKRSSKVSSLHLGFLSGVCVFQVEMWVLCLCAVVCMALTVQEHRGYTPDRSVLFPLVTPLGSVCY